MANPLAGLIGGVAGGSGNGGGFDLNGFAQQFNQFRNGFRGNPQQILNEALSSGKVTQAQVNKATQLAKTLMGVLKL